MELEKEIRENLSSHHVTSTFKNQMNSVLRNESSAETSSNKTILSKYPNLVRWCASIDQNPKYNVQTAYGNSLDPKSRGLFSNLNHHKYYLPATNSIDNQSFVVSPKVEENFKSAKGHWTSDEDRILTRMVEYHGPKGWPQIASTLRRSSEQCRERWNYHLSPRVKKDSWSEEEDIILIGAHAEMGNKWTEIAKRLQGRTPNSVKNHWNITKRRTQSQRKYAKKNPIRGSILEDYIKSLDSDAHNFDLSKLDAGINTGPHDDNGSPSQLPKNPEAVKSAAIDPFEDSNFFGSGRTDQGLLGQFPGCSSTAVVDKIFEEYMDMDNAPMMQNAGGNDMDLYEMIQHLSDKINA